MSFCADLRRTILTRRKGALAVAAVALPLMVVPASAPGAPAGPVVGWRRAAPLPLPRTEVAAARLGAEIAVAGGFLPDGSTTAAVHAYSPHANRWRRLPDLPIAVNHAMAASYRGRLYVVGGYTGSLARSSIVRAAFVLVRGRWQQLPRPPEGRAAAAAAVVGHTISIVGGVGPEGLAQRALIFDVVRRRWTTSPGPTPREHLAAAAVGGRVYAIAGRRAGIDTNVAIVEAYSRARRRWLRVAAVPEPRGGTGAAVLGREIVSVGGEEPNGTIATVYAYDIRRARWRRLPDLPTPRHGLGVVAAAGRVYAIAGGTRPGLTVSGTNEYLPLAQP